MILRWFQLPLVSLCFYIPRASYFCRKVSIFSNVLVFFIDRISVSRICNHLLATWSFFHYHALLIFGLLLWMVLSVCTWFHNMFTLFLLILVHAHICVYCHIFLPVSLQMLKCGWPHISSCSLLLICQY
jgi:hypothetical protein